MIFRASVIFLTYLICNLVSLLIIYVPQFIIDLCHQDQPISLTGYELIISLPEKIYTSVLSLDMDIPLVILLILICSIKIICGAISGILGAISWKIYGRIHPCFGILVCLSVPFITIGVWVVSSFFFYDDLRYNASGGIDFTFIIVTFMLETGFICFTWWIAKNFCDTKGREIGISLKSTDKKTKYAFLFSFYIFLMTYVISLPVRPFFVFIGLFMLVLDVNDTNEHFLVKIYQWLVIITVIFLIIYAFYRMRFKASLKMKQYTRVALIFTSVWLLLLSAVMLFYFFQMIGNDMSEKYAGYLDTISPLGICVLFVGMNLCVFGILFSFSFWLARCFAGKFKTYDEANV